MAEREDRTHAPSERRLLRARSEGQAPLSRELVTLAGLGAVTLVAAMGLPGIGAALGRRLASMLTTPDSSPGAALGQAGWAWGLGAGAVMGSVALAGAAAVLLQTGFLLNGGAMVPDFGRVSPKRGLRRVLGGGSAADAAKALAKLGVLGWAVWSSMLSVWPILHDAARWTPAAMLDRLTRELMHLLLLVLAAQAVIALLDVGWTRWRFTQGLRMSREDLKDEAREADGDPRVKSRLRQLRQARMRRRMVMAVAKATVVITNPTHYAVALSYERGARSAPRIVAKGVDEMAARIRAAAQKAGVPLVANPPLARALYPVPIDAEVPAEHFRTVAEIIAYVWRLRGRGG